MMSENFINKIRSKYSELNNCHKNIADFYLKSDLSVINLSTREVAEKVNCSNASVSRFAKIIGYNGYLDMQNSIQDYFNNRLNPLKALEDSMDLYDVKNNYKNIFDKSIQMDITDLKKIDKYITEKEFDLLVEKIKNADKIYIFGVGVEKPLAEFLLFRLKRFGLNVQALTKGSAELYDDIQLIKNNDLLIAFGFYRYPRELNILFDYTKSKDIPSVFITDDPTSPYKNKVTMHIASPRGPVGVMHSLVVPMAFLNALAIALGTEDIYQENMRRMEEIRDEFNFSDYLK